MLIEAGRLATEGKPYALATVVGVERPTSARLGDRAIVMPDGALLGWVGGSCSEPEVVREALRALAEGEPRLVQVEGGCASEGRVDVLVEPCLPAPLLAVAGDGPAAVTLAGLARTVGWRVGSEVEQADAVVVATMGRGDEDILAAALRGSAGYVGLVASARRAAAVLAALRARGVDEEALAHVRSPAGLDLGPSTQEEIAVAVLAELVAWRHTRGALPAPPAEAVDPVCGMRVALPGADTVEHDGTTYAFCGPGCRARFEADPARYAGVGTV